MQIHQIGVCALKGGRHQPRQQVRLTDTGPEGDRDFAIVDLARGQVLRTVEHPSLTSCEAQWADGMLTLTINGQQVTAAPKLAPGIVQVDYWGRDTAMQIVTGPWQQHLNRLFSGDVALARTTAPGGVVFGGAVTLATTSSLQRLEAASGTAIDPRRFRSTFTIDTGEADSDGAHRDERGHGQAPGHVEDAWIGRDIEVGAARLHVTGGVPRCAVIDLDPDTEERGTQLLKTLGGYRRTGTDIMFGVYAEVIRPGLVRLGDEARLIETP
ncbi:MAG: MOSC domain-containing protein [Cryobacterium sp.]